MFRVSTVVFIVRDDADVGGGDEEAEVVAISGSLSRCVFLTVATSKPVASFDFCLPSFLPFFTSLKRFTGLHGATNAEMKRNEMSDSLCRPFSYLRRSFLHFSFYLPVIDSPDCECETSITQRMTQQKRRVVMMIEVGSPRCVSRTPINQS